MNKSYTNHQQKLENDLRKEFLNENCMYLKLFLLLYADETVIFAESTEELQTILIFFLKYCSEWKLSINVSKTKIVVFSKRKHNNKKEFLLNNEEVEGLSHVSIQL